MNLEILKEYLSFLVQTEYNLCSNRKALELQNHNCFSFYKLIANKSQPQIDHQLMSKFVQSFTYNFQVSQLHEMANNVNFQMFPIEEHSSQQELLANGIDLFLKRYSTSGKMNFRQFSLFLKEEEQLPSKAVELDFAVKKKIYQLIEQEIQLLLDAEKFRKAVGFYYKNLPDLFQMVASQGQLGWEQINNLYLMIGQRKQSLFFDMLAIRFPLPMDQSTFKRWFTVAQIANKYKQKTKIYYSSIKRKKFEFNRDEEEGRFMTPSGKKTAAAVGSSTKMTKGERLNSIKRSAIEVSRFVTQDLPESKGYSILEDIFSEQQRINQMKKQLLYQHDYDLQLIYQRKGMLFSEILNKKYGSCNFTSFVRYIVPQDYEHRYYSFIKYNKDNRLSRQTNQMLENLIQEELRKESVIDKLWQQKDREMVFRSYCKPGDKGINHRQLSKYFTERECKLLLDRFDPHKTGLITLQYFL